MKTRTQTTLLKNEVIKSYVSEEYLLGLGNERPNVFEKNLCMYVCHVRYIWKTEGIGCPGSGVKVSSELPNVVLWKSSIYS